jgi:hypothetical protein
MTQSTLGQGGTHACVLHDSDFTSSDAAGHSLPPFADDFRIRFVNVCRPPPHGLEHAPDGMNSLTTQSTGTGHACVLHASVCTWSSAAGHAAPPHDAGVTTTRFNVRTPPPHVAEQRPDGKNELMTQSTFVHSGAHACALHVSVLTFSESAGHALPPWAGDVTTLRMTVCTPPPHDREHEPEGLKSLITQSTGTGHACVLHASDLT